MRSLELFAPGEAHERKRITTPREGGGLAPARGRSYPMGRTRRSFKADGDETASAIRFRNGGWSPTRVPGSAFAPGNEASSMSSKHHERAGRRRVDACQKALSLVPGGVIHDFENRGSVRAGVLNLFVPGTFRIALPAIAQWYAQHPAGDVTVAATATTA